jgi:hypothetical protein
MPVILSKEKSAMWERFKSVPLFLRVICGCFLFLAANVLVLQMLHIGPDPLPPDNQGGQVVDPTGGGGLPQSGANRPSPYNVGGDAESKSQLLAQYESQLADLNASVEACKGQLLQFQQQQQEAMMNSAGASGGNAMQPPCFQNFNQEIVQEALLETYISRLKTGNMSLTVCQANVGLKGCESMQIASGSGGSSGSSSGSGGDPYAAVERSTRQGIRGNTMYTDSRGQQHELPTASYYFEDMQTGEFIPSNSPNPPNNTHTYEQLTPEN